MTVGNVGWLIRALSSNVAGTHKSLAEMAAADPAPQHTSMGWTGSRLDGEGSLSDRLPRQGAVFRNDVLQRRQTVCNQVPLPVRDWDLG